MPTERALQRANEIAAKYGGNTQTTAGAASSRPAATGGAQSSAGQTASGKNQSATGSQTQTSAPADQKKTLTVTTQSAADRANAIFQKYGQAAADNLAARERYRALQESGLVDRSTGSEGEQLYQEQGSRGNSTPTIDEKIKTTQEIIDAIRERAARGEWTPHPFGFYKTAEDEIAEHEQKLVKLRRQKEKTEASEAFGNSLLNLLGTAATMMNSPYLPTETQTALARQQAENAKALQDATRRYNEARKAIDWNGRDNLIDQYKTASWGILGNAAQQAYNAAAGVQLSPADQRAATEQQLKTVERERQLREELETRDVAAGNGLRDYSLPERVVTMAGSVARGIGSAGANLVSNLGKTYGTQQAISQAYSPERMLTDRMLGVDWEQDVKQTRDALTGEQAQAFYKQIDDVADRLQQDAERETQKAKEGLSVLGQAAVDIGINMMEMGFDTAVGTVTGTPLAPMFARVYGQSVGEARQAGASAERQALYGLTKAGIETATEKMFDVFGVLGGGSMEGKVEKLVGKLAESDVGRTFLRVLINAQGEGVEELVSGIAEPFANLIIDNNWQGWDWSDIAYSYIIGSTIGLIGEGTQVLSGADSARNAELRTQQGIEAGLVQAGFDTKAAREIAEITVKGMTGEELTEAERATLSKTQERLTQMAEEQNVQTGNSKNAAPDNRSGQIGNAGGQRAVEHPQGTQGAGPYANNTGDIANKTGDIANDSADIMNNTTDSGAAAIMTGGNANVENQTQSEGVLGQAQTVPPAGEEAGRAGAPDAAAASGAAGLEAAQSVRAGAEAARPAGDGAERERVSDAGSGRDAGERSGGEADSLAERTRRHRKREAEQHQRAADLRRYGDALRARGEARIVSSQELGIRNGTDAQNLTMIDEAHYNNRLRELDEQIRRESGYDDVVFVIGTIHTVNGGKARGAITDSRIVIQLDHNQVPAENIAAHEVFHAKARTDPELVEAARQKITERFTPEEFRRMLDSYIDALTGSVLDINESTDPEHIQELAELVIEELMADAYADINFFGLGADRYGDTVRETVEERRELQEQNRGGERETRGPPQQRAKYSHGTGIRPDHDIEAENISDGRAAVERLMREAQESDDPENLVVRNAMYRSDIGHIDFRWGTPGKGDKFKGGYGLAHIIEKRNAESGRGVETLYSIIEAIAKAEDADIQHSNHLGEDYRRLRLHYEGTTAVLSKSPGDNHWLLTGWDNNETAANATGEVHDSTDATAATPTRTRRDGDATVFNTSINEKSDFDNTKFSADDSEGNEDSDSIPSDRELLLTAASRENAGQDLTAYAKKNGKVETLERKLTHLQEAMESADEEERPQLEAMAAKTEKQLNRAKDDLGKMEANPVLKKALDRERAAWREVNPTEAARAMRTLNEENAAMRELVDYWKGQAKRTSDRDRTVMPEDTRRMARNLLREHSSEASTERIADRLQKLGNYLVSSDDLDFRTVRNWARAASREIVDNSYILVDENADTREKLRDYLRSTRLKISDELRGDVTDLADFRRQNMGMLRLAKDGRDIDSVYDELGDMFGEDLFPRDVTRNSEQLNKILDVMDRLQPSYEYMYSRYERDEMVEHVANEIIDGLLSGDVRQSKTYADRQYERMANRIAELGEKNEAAKDRLRDERRTRRQLVQSKVSELRQKSIERNESYRKRVAIDKTVRRLSKYLTENSAKNHVPENMKNLVGNLLMSIDTLSPRSGEKAQQAYLRRMDDVARVVANQLKYMDGGEMENSMFLDFPPELSDILNEHIGAIRDAVENDETWVTSRMSLKQLEELDTILNAVSKAVTTANELMASANNAKVSEVSEKTIAHLDELGPATADNKATRFLQFQNTTPYYFFKRFGEGGQQIFRGLQEGWSKLGFHSRDIIDYAEKTYTGEEARKAEGDVQEFKLHTRTLEEDGTDNLRSEDAQTVYLSKAQIMELYALSKRRQALGHLLGAGIRIGDIKDASTGKTIHQADNYLLSPEDLAEITGTLTEREKEIADALQKHMNTVGSDWGNEVSMARFGIRQFTEDNYWPIKTDSRNRAVRDPGADATNLFRLLNMSFTKSAVRDASNAIDIGSAFDTYANHMADMAKYNALGLPMLDAMKWFSYNTATDPDSRGQYTTTSVQKSAERAYGSEAQRYFIQFMKDMNGTHEGGRDLEQFGSKMLSNYKVAAVGANLRVAALQPTAYVRAAAVLDPKYLVKGLAHNKQGREEALKYSGTAVWKDLGFYDTNINNGLRSMIKHSDGAVEQIREKSMILAELGDKTTWGAIWNACKSQVSDTQHLEGEALMKATAELFDEVIYRTQVMDSTMTRSHSMRQKGVYAGMTTAFMSEPTLSYNMMLDAYNEYQQELRKTEDVGKALNNAGPKLARTMAVYAATAAAASIVESLMNAWRDDDKYQTFVQKWLEAEFGDGNLLNGNLMQDLLIHNKLPFIKEFDSLINGYSNSRMDTEWLSNIVKTYQIWRETLQLATGKLDKPTDITYKGKMTLWGKLYQTLKTASQMAGLPIGNAGREVIALYNNTIGKVTGDTISTYSPGAKNEVKYAVLDGWLSAEEAQRILTEEGILEDEAKAEAEVIKWTAQSQGESVTSTQAKAVQALTGSGAVSTQEAVTTTAEIWDRIAALEPLPGRASVTKTQKYQTIANSDIPIEQQFTMFGALMEDDELLKARTAYDYGVTPKTYFDAKVAMYNVSSDGQISKAEAKQALDGQRSLSNSDRAVIWQLQNKKFQPQDNPYDTTIGSRVYDIITGKAEAKGDLTLGSWGQYSTGTTPQEDTAPTSTGLSLGSWDQYSTSPTPQEDTAPAFTGLSLGSW